MIDIMMPERIYAWVVGGEGITTSQHEELSRGTGRLTPDQFKKHLENLSKEG